ncbi:LacI family DNA-binding transcriptional regulator [Microbacterium amylolyticum]|uniref:DNA-binding LacI/PurR family transcriptional regulator n=1 Tax=Microbacterium amylolyticum TaxID=936337 RepID=A0ABS4ZGB0_9MICO|nr:LacI family DNA-binding transcriptional regulator [Microbacterium amylolyticum]MBP2436314.1 DNA-binding LacI/PurR family transcriptional regulator [Microbacterium amylolyticum]
MADAPERINIRHIASLVGVSHMTVSRVLSGHPSVRESTKQRVMEVVEELNFRPNSAARELATRRTRRIGVMIESAAMSGPESALRYVEIAARAIGYSVTSVALQSEEGLGTAEAVGQLTAQGIDGLCVVAPRSSSVAALRRIRIDVPVLVVKADSDPTFLTASADQRSGADLVVDHLVGLGHRDIVHVAGPLDWLDARARERAFHARMKEWGHRERPIVVGDWSSDFGYDWARRLTRIPDYTAIFAANDQMAMGILHGLHEAGIRVPEDISVVGFDDLELARHTLPPLTTVRQNFAELGRVVVESLRAAAEGEDIPQRTLVPVELIARGSTAAPRSR